MKLTSCCSLVLLAAAVAACDDDNIVEPWPHGFATIQVINAAVPTVDTVGVYVDDEQLPRTWTRARVAPVGGACAAIPEGPHTLHIKPLRGGADLASVQHTFAAGQRYTVVFHGPQTARTATVLTDTFTPPAAGSNLVRFINATATAGDVYATAPNATLTGVSPTVPNLAPIGGATADLPWTTIPTTSTQIRLFNVGTTSGTPRANLTLSGLPGNRVTNVIFMNPGTPAGATALRFNPCT